MVKRSTWIVIGLIVVVALVGAYFGGLFQVGELAPGAYPPTAKSVSLYDLGTGDYTNAGIGSSFKSGSITTSFTAKKTGNTTGTSLRFSGPPCPSGNTNCAGRAWSVSIQITCAGTKELDITGTYTPTSYDAQWATYDGSGHSPATYGTINAGQTCGITVFLNCFGGDSCAVGGGQVYWMKLGSDYEMVVWGEPPTSGGGALSVSFTYNRTAQGLTVSFEGSVSGGTAPYVFSWDFGDGQTSLGQRASHTYAAAGTYIVRLSVTDANAASGSASQSVGVGAANYTITSGFTYAVVSGTTVKFDGGASGGALPYTFFWDFGDGVRLNESSGSVTHTYSSGTYQASMYVVDSNGKQSAVSSGPALTFYSGQCTANCGGSSTSGLTAIQIAEIVMISVGVGLIAAGVFLKKRLIIVVGVALAVIGVLLPYLVK